MAAIEDLISKIQDESLRKQIAEEVNKLKVNKKFGLIYENHLPERAVLFDMPVKIGSKVTLRRDKKKIYQVAEINGETATCIEGKEQKIFPLSELLYVAEIGEPIYPYLKQLDSIKNAPTNDLWHTLIEAENYHALQLLDYMYHGKVDCIYIDPPYNTGAKDWKYNNDYVDGSDQYRHSKWLSMMEKRLKLAKELLNPADSVLIVTIDEKEYLHLGCLLEELFPDARIQMVSSAINGKGVARENEFARVNEYLFVILFGNCCVNAIQLPTEWAGNIKKTTTNKVRWGSLMRSGTGSAREDSPGCFYPIFISEDKERFMGVGDPLPVGVDRNTIKIPMGQIALWPIHADGKEGRWQYGKNNFETIQKKGYVRISTQTNRGEATLRYISKGWQKKVENGTIKVIGKSTDGSLIFDDDEYQKSFVPGNQWWIPSHDATEYGSKELNKMIDKRFDSFPKSLYAVHDTIRFFVANKKDVLILDFFAGSGTTLHAVNLLNDEDGGNRRCILVTNNEVSLEEAKNFEENGIQEGSDEWNAHGIARFVTWARIRCSILGQNVKGEALKGNYLGSDRPMSEGFSANAIFFKLGFLDKTSVSLGKQLQELISILWLKAGAIGECPPAEANEKYMIYSENNFAVLVDPVYVNEFKEKLSPNIEVVYIITDYEKEFNDISTFLSVKKSYQLYKDYLENFKINTR